MKCDTVQNDVNKFEIHGFKLLSKNLSFCKNFYKYGRFSLLETI